MAVPLKLERSRPVIYCLKECAEELAFSAFKLLVGATYIQTRYTSFS